jgi:hypothetical protein
MVRLVGGMVGLLEAPLTGAMMLTCCNFQTWNGGDVAAGRVEQAKTADGDGGEGVVFGDVLGGGTLRGRRRSWRADG